MAVSRNPFRACWCGLRQRQIENFNSLLDSISLANRYNSAIARHIHLLHDGLNAKDTHREW